MAGIMVKYPGIGSLGGEAYQDERNGVETKKKEITINCETSTVIMPKKNITLRAAGMWQHAIA